MTTRSHTARTGMRIAATLSALALPIALASAAHADEREVESGSIAWGFKESYRSYILGNIAKGEWILTDGATYETPHFGWEQASGSLDLAELEGSVHFAGAIEFTGHAGAMHTTIENLTLEFDGEETAYLHLDLIGVSMADALGGNPDNVQTAEQVQFLELDLAAGTITIDESAGTLTAEAVPTTFTEAGFAVFPNYNAGTAFDPITFSITVGEVAANPQTSDEPTGEAAPSASEPETSVETETPAADPETSPVEADPTQGASSAEAPESETESGLSYGVVVAIIAGLGVAGFAVWQGLRRKKNNA